MLGDRVWYCLDGARARPAYIVEALGGPRSMYEAEPGQRANLLVLLDGENYPQDHVDGRPAYEQTVFNPKAKRDAKDKTMRVNRIDGYLAWLTEIPFDPKGSPGSFSCQLPSEIAADDEIEPAAASGAQETEAPPADQPGPE